MKRLAYIVRLMARVVINLLYSGVLCCGAAVGDDDILALVLIW